MIDLQLPPSPARVGIVPEYRLSAALELKRFLNGQPGFSDCGLTAVVTIVGGGFGVRVLYPHDEPIRRDFPRMISDVPVTVGPYSDRRRIPRKSG